MERVTDSLTSADGTRIVYHMQGKGVPLVILHGSLATTELYQPLADLLEARYRVVLVERRGYGLSEQGPRPSDFARQAADLAAVLAIMDEPGYVFGHSCGGLVALHAMSDSLAVRRLALYEPPVAFVGPTLVATLNRIRDLVADGRRAEAVIEFMTAISDSLPPADLLRQVAERLAPQAPGLITDLECITGMDTDLSRWSTLNTPTLLLTGEKTDAYGKNSIELLQQVLPNARTTRLRGQGHHFDDPRPVAEALSEFFA